MTPVSGQALRVCRPHSAEPPPTASADCPQLAQPKAPGVRVPREVRDLGLAPVCVAVYAVLVQHAPASSWRVEHLTHEQIAALVGRSVSATTTALEALREKGVLASRQRGFGKPAVHTLLMRYTRGARFDVVPYRMLTDLQTGAVTPAQLVTWLHLEEALGARGRTRDSARALAARARQSIASLRAHVGVLVKRGFVLRTLRHPGWLLEVGPAAGRIPPEPLEAPAASAAGSASPELVVDDQGSGAAPGIRHAERQESGMPTSSLSPEVLAPEDNYFPSFAKRRHLSDARTCATDGRSRPKGTSTSPTLTPEHHTKAGATTRAAGVRRVKSVRERLVAPMTRGAMARSDVREVLEALPGEWTRGEQYRWRPGLAARIARWLDGDADRVPLPGAVIVQALTRVGDVDAVAGWVLPSADAAIRAIRADLAAGLTCPECGHESGADGCQECGFAALEAAQTREEVAELWRRNPLPVRLKSARELVKVLGLANYLESMAGLDPQVEAALLADVERARCAARGRARVRDTLKRVRIEVDTSTSSVGG